jgi:hypothetical protein
MRKHSRGPWGIAEPVKIDGKHYAAGATYDIERPGKRQDWSVARIAAQSPNAEANARLIAAAPDLLHALKLAESVWSGTLARAYGGKPQDQREPVINCIREAIAKAEGRADA